jgi:hypothetical protein
MDVAAGPCVPLPGRKHSLRSVHQQQGPERPEQMRALFVVLGGAERDRETALELIEQRDRGTLFRCSDRFLQLMADENERQIHLSAQDTADGDPHSSRSVRRQEELDAAWMATGQWHRGQVSTRNRLVRIAWARVAQEKGQALYCWYGPSVREYVIVSGQGPYPGL